MHFQLLESNFVLLCIGVAAKTKQPIFLKKNNHKVLIHKKVYRGFILNKFGRESIDKKAKLDKVHTSSTP